MKKEQPPSMALALMLLHHAERRVLEAEGRGRIGYYSNPVRLIPYRDDTLAALPAAPFWLPVSGPAGSTACAVQRKYMAQLSWFYFTGSYL